MSRNGSTANLKMLRYYWVFCRDALVGCFKAVSKEDAEKQAYMKHGSASKYSGNGRDDFRAEVITL